MPDWKRILHPRMRHPKRRGEWAEAAFLAKALGQGLTVCKPCGDTEPFDYVVFNVRRSMNRVQVKSSWKRSWAIVGYKVENNHRRFNRSECDFVVVVLPDEDAWYVIPVDAVHGQKVIWMYPRKPSRFKRVKTYEQYREAWHLLTGDEPGAWERYQRFTIHANAE